MKQTIPVLSLTDFYSTDPQVKAEFVNDVGEALTNVGFFSLVDHGIDLELIKKNYRLVQQFFELPEEVKRKYDLDNQGQRGYTSFGKETAKGSNSPDLKSFYHVGQELPSDSPYTYPKNVWPKEIIDFKEVSTSLYRQLEETAKDILKAAAIYLGERENLFSNMIADGNTILRAIHYPQVKEGQLPGSIRSAPHEDINLITLLCESTAPGLELLQANQTWLPIYKLDGQIIVNSSDMFYNVTNGVFRSTTHRVINPEPNKNVARFSLPCFVHPRSQVDLSPLDSCIKRVGEKRTRDISAGEFLAERLKELKL